MKSSYQEAYDKWVVDQTPENMSRVLDTLMPTINSEIMRYEGPKTHLRSRAKALAVKAVRTYNPYSGAKLQSWVTTNLKPLSRYGQGLRDVKAPELAIRRAAEIDRVSKALEDDLGRAPTDEELADEIGISPKKIQRIRHQVVASVPTGSFDVDAGGEDSAMAAPAVSTINKVPYAAEAVYMSLDPRDRMIYDYRTGSHGKSVLQNSEIAKRFGVAPASITQRSNAIAKMIQDLAV